MPSTTRRTTPRAPIPAVPGLEVSIEPVRSAPARDEFITWPLELYRGDPNFVPPIVAERRDFLDGAKNPFLAHAELELFLAKRAGRVVGRIAVVIDAVYNQFYNAEVGFFGMFESIDDAEVARALTEACAGWSKARGMKQLIGPVNLSLNHDCGLLLDGFEQPPAMMMPYNPPYYAGLFERCGLKKFRDLWTFEMSTAVPPPDRIVRIAEKARENGRIRVRPIEMAHLSEEIRRIKSVYDAILDRQFLFVPMNDEEFAQVAARLRPLVQVRPELCLIAESDGEPVAFSLTLPDPNLALKAAGGYLTRFGLPIGLFKLAWAARQIDRLRVLMMAIKPGYRRRGIDALLAIETMRAARRLGYSWAELGWTTEDNHLINRGLSAMGARRYKTYRLYQRAL